MVPAPFIVVVDANVLFPLTLRDTVLRAAAAGFYQLRWSAEILDEMERNLVSSSTMPANKAARLRALIEKYLRQLVASRRDLVEHRRRLVEHWRGLGLPRCCARRWRVRPCTADS